MRGASKCLPTTFTSGGLPFPKSLPEFQRLFPDDAPHLDDVEWYDEMHCKFYIDWDYNIEEAV